MLPAYIPTGLVQLALPAAYIPQGRVMPPNSFDASALQLDQRMNENRRFGYYPVELSGDWSGQLAFKMFRPYVEDPHGEVDIQDGGLGAPSPAEETYWYSWLDRHGIGAAIYGTYEFRFGDDSALYRGLLTELVGGDPLLVAHNITDFSHPRTRQLIQARWNDRSRAEWQRIDQILTHHRVVPGDLQLLLSDNGRLTVIDPELFAVMPAVPESEPINQWDDFDTFRDPWEEPVDEYEQNTAEMSRSFGFSPGQSDRAMDLLERSLSRLVDVR